MEALVDKIHKQGEHKHKHAKVFESLLDESRSSAVLQFYSAFSQLTNEGVRNIITKHGIFGLGKDNQKSFLLSDARLSILNCFFEAQLCDESFYRQILGTSITPLPLPDPDIYSINLSPLDCISLFYFLNSTRAVTRGNVSVNLFNCRTDSHSEAVLLGEFPEHGKSSTTRVLDCVTEWTMDSITDTGLACIGTALTTNNTLKVLTLCGQLFLSNVYVGDKGLVPFLEALQKNQSLESLCICWSSTHPVQSLKKMGECVAKSSLKQLSMVMNSPSLETEETFQEWTQSVQVGATDLINCLEYHQLQRLELIIEYGYLEAVMHTMDQVNKSVVDSFDDHVKLVNSKRQMKGFHPIMCTIDLLM